MSFQTWGREPPTLTGGLLESETEPRELSAVCSCPSCQHPRLLVTSTPLGFLRVQLPLRELSRRWASAVLGLCLVGAEPR